MKHLIGKRFELTEVAEMGTGNIVSLTLVGDNQVIRLETDEDFICASIESLVDPPSEEVKTDVFGGNFVAAPL